MHCMCDIQPHWLSYTRHHHLFIAQMILFAPLALFYLKVVSRQYQDGSEVWGVLQTV